MGGQQTCRGRWSAVVTLRESKKRAFGEYDNISSGKFGWGNIFLQLSAKLDDFNKNLIIRNNFRAEKQALRSICWRFCVTGVLLTQLLMLAFVGDTVKNIWHRIASAFARLVSYCQPLDYSTSHDDQRLIHQFLDVDVNFDDIIPVSPTETKGAL